MKLRLTGKLAAGERGCVSEVGKGSPGKAPAPGINHGTGLPYGLGTFRFGLTLT